MATVVQKYGGSSVATVERLRQVAEQVVERHETGDRVVVVVSAMGKSTDELIALARGVSDDPPQRELDMLVTAGERISMALLSMAVREGGGRAISFTGSQSGIITDNKHQGARIVEVTPWRVQEALDEGLIAIIAGYQGVSREREITTLGRGGTDTTAVAMAAALGADACEIYSDVDGVYSADPRVCAQAKLLPRVSYETMQTMAGLGAKVLNADAVEFAKRAEIVIHARKTGDPSGRETRVTSGQHAQGAAASCVAAIVGNPNVSRVGGDGPAMVRFADAVGECGARLMRVSGAGALQGLVDRTNVPGREHAAVERIATAFGVTAEACAAVSIVGTQLLSGTNTWSLARQALAECANVQGWFLSDEALVAVVADIEADKSVRALHNALV